MAATALRRLLPTNLKAAQVFQPGKQQQGHDFQARNFHASSPKQYEYPNDYIHAPKMYNLPAMKGRNLKFGILVFGGVGAGILLPCLLIRFQQRKAAGVK